MLGKAERFPMIAANASTGESRYFGIPSPGNPASKSYFRSLLHPLSTARSPARVRVQVGRGAAGSSP
jgi:hypothetical protein